MNFVHIYLLQENWDKDLKAMIQINLIKDHLPWKWKVSKKYESFELTPYDISIGLGKESASGEKKYHQNVCLHCLQKRKISKGKCSVLIKTYFIFIFVATIILQLLWYKNSYYIDMLFLNQYIYLKTLIFIRWINW